MSNSNLWPNSAPLRDIRLRNLSDLTLTFQSRSRSNVIMLLDSPYVISYWSLISNTRPNSAPLRDISF